MKRASYNRQDLRLVAIDSGNGAVKYRSENSGVASFPAVYSTELSTLKDFHSRGLTDDSEFLINFRGHDYALGETVYSHGLMPVTIAHHSRIESEFYSIMFAGALSRLYKAGGVFRVVVSLPPLMYFDSEKVIKRLAGEYVIGLNGNRPNPYIVPDDQLVMIPEGFGAAMVMALDKKGNIVPNAGGRAVFTDTVGVIDVGTYTTDFLMLDRLTPIRNGTSSLAYGLSRIHQALRSHAQSQGYNIEPYKADEILQAGTFPKAGRRVSFTNERRAWSEDLAGTIAGQVRQLWNGGDDVSNIVIAGGGALYVWDYLRREFPQVAELPKTSWSLNCEGGFRYGRFMQILDEQGA